MDDFKVQGHYCVSNAGGFEVEYSDCGDRARLKDAFGGDNPKVSDWLEIEHIEDEDNPGEMVQVIDPNGYDIPVNLVMRANS